MKVLFDHNVPRRLRQSFREHSVRTAREMGWSELENGELLKAAQAAGFDVMVTGDKNISYQQDLRGRKLALVVLSTNDWNAVKEHTETILNAVDASVPGSFHIVSVVKNPGARI